MLCALRVLYVCGMRVRCVLWYVCCGCVLSVCVCGTSVLSVCVRCVCVCARYVSGVCSVYVRRASVSVCVSVCGWCAFGVWPVCI